MSPKAEHERGTSNSPPDSLKMSPSGHGDHERAQAGIAGVQQVAHGLEEAHDAQQAQRAGHAREAQHAQQDAAAALALGGRREHR